MAGICDTCATPRCKFQSGIKREKCDFYTENTGFCFPKINYCVFEYAAKYGVEISIRFEYNYLIVKMRKELNRVQNVIPMGELMLSKIPESSFQMLLDSMLVELGDVNE